MSKNTQPTAYSGQTIFNLIYDPIRRTIAVDANLTSGIRLPEYDSITVTYPDTVTETYTYKLSGTTVATITVVYTDTSKDFVSSLTKT